jgi:mannose-6-phosphate isomerase-like protein (cupin superfamily)
MRQTEYFEVEQGTLAVVRNEKEVTLTKDDGMLKIPAGTR